MKEDTPDPTAGMVLGTAGMDSRGRMTLTGRLRDRLALSEGDAVTFEIRNGYSVLRAGSASPVV